MNENYESNLIYVIWQYCIHDKLLYYNNFLQNKELKKEYRYLIFRFQITIWLKKDSSITRIFGDTMK